MHNVAVPTVLFLDEPTTGLDSAAAFSVVKYIQKLVAQTGVVCIMTIHQVNIDETITNEWMDIVPASPTSASRALKL